MIQIVACYGAEARTGITVDDVAPLVRPTGTDTAAAVPVNGDGESGGAAPGALPPVKHSRKPAPPQRILWVDVRDPNDDDWSVLQDRFGFHPLAIDGAREQDQWAKMALYDGYLTLSVRAWTGGDPREPAHDVMDVTTEVDVFLGPDYIVTIHDGRCPAIDETMQRWQSNPGKLPAIGRYPAYLLYLLLDNIVDDYFPVMDRLDEQIDDVESEIYGSEAITDIKPALRFKKRLLLLRQAITPMRDVLNQILRGDEPTLTPIALRVYFQDVYDHTLRLVEQVDLHRDILSGAMDALMAQTSNRLNKVMKTLTSVSAILMIVGLIPSIFGMNFKYMPDLDARNGYYLALAAMVLIAVVLSLFFRKIDWF